MTAVWDDDTGTVTIIANDKDGNPVNLSATTERTVIARNVETRVATALDITSDDLPTGKVIADASPLEVGTYKVALRCVDASGTATYPSAESGGEDLSVVADLDAVQ